MCLGFAFAAFLCFVHLGDFPLLVPDEGRNAEVAREMKLQGSWLVPTYDGATYLDKPAFFFKSVALSLEAFGDTEWAARLPSALSAVLWLLALLGFTLKHYGARTAALAVCVVAATPLFMAFSRIVIFDMMLGLFVTTAILSAHLAGEHSGKRKWQLYLLASLFSGLATLVKGPVGFLIPLLVMSVYHVVSGTRREIRSFFSVGPVLVFLGVVLPWFVGLSLECPDFPYYGIVKESISRFTTPEFRRTQPFYYYGIIVSACFFPFSTVLPYAFWEGVRRRFEWQAADRLFVIWALVVLVFFSLSKSKLPGYILTGVVAMGVLVARVLVLAFEGEKTAVQILRRSLVTLGVLALILAIPLLLGTGAWMRFFDVPWLKTGFAERFMPLFPGTLVALGCTALLAFTAWIMKGSRLAIAGFMVFPLLLVTLNFDWIPRYAAIKSAKALEGSLPRDLPSDTEFACVACMPHGLPFYLGRKITVFTEDGGELTSNYVLFSLREGKPWPPSLVPFKDLNAYLGATSHPIFLLARREGLSEFKKLVGERASEILTLSQGYIGVLMLPGAP